MKSKLFVSFLIVNTLIALKVGAAELGVKAGVLVHAVRLACTGNPSGPSLYRLLEVMHKEKALARIERALAKLTLT